MGELQLAWEDRRWASEVQRLAGDLGCSCDRVLIETVDGICGSHAVMGAIDFAIKGWAGWLSAGVLSVAGFFELDLASEQVFPGFDSVWFLRAGGPVPQSPPFLTYFATMDRTASPRRRKGDGTEPVSWDEIQDWMRKNQAVAGVASGFSHVLTVKLI